MKGITSLQKNAPDAKIVDLDADDPKAPVEATKPKTAAAKKPAAKA